MAAAAELREPHRVARYLEDMTSVFNKWYDTKECRMLPQGDEPVRPVNEARLMLVVAARTVLANGLGLLGVTAPGADVAAVPTSHPSGWAHADGALRGPHWLREPDDPNALVPHLWSTTAHKVDGVLHVGGRAVPDVVADVNTPAYLLDEDDFRGRARAFRDAFADRDGWDVYYAGKAFLCTTVARWVAEEGLLPRRLHRR